MPQYLDTILRFLHILSAIALLGGTIFFLAVMIPAVRILDDGLRTSILQAARNRFYRITHPALTILILTGFYNYVKYMPDYKLAPKYIHAILGVKILFALTIAAIVFTQSFGLLKGCPIRWAKLNLILGILIVALAAVARTLHTHTSGG